MEWLVSVFFTIETEIKTGRTFARLALDSNDSEKTARNTANAQKAYDAAQRWAERIDLAAVPKEIAEQLELLKDDLAKLEKRSKSSDTRRDKSG